MQILGKHRNTPCNPTILDKWNFALCYGFNRLLMKTFLLCLFLLEFLYSFPVSNQIFHLSFRTPNLARFSEKLKLITSQYTATPFITPVLTIFNYLIRFE